MIIDRYDYQNTLFYGEKFNQCYVIAYAIDRDDVNITTNGWETVTLSMTNYNGPTYGSSEYAVSAWIYFGSIGEISIVAGNMYDIGPWAQSGDNIDSAWYVGMLGYIPNVGFIDTVSQSISNFPIGEISGIIAYDTQLRENPNNDIRSIWLDGYNATISATLSL